MPEDFQYDVSLSHSSKDKAALRPLAERLPKTAKIDEDMERSRVLVLCMSANAFCSDWVLVESGTLKSKVEKPF